MGFHHRGTEGTKTKEGDWKISEEMGGMDKPCPCMS